MGFDLYGNSPQAYEDKEFPIYTKYKDMDWDEKEEHADWKTESEKFWEEEHKLDRATGSYFRANVWWWRQLWNFTCMVCDDVMTENDRDAGDSNDGIEITEETCAKMLPLMKQAIKNKDHEKYEADVTQYIDGVKKDKNGWIADEKDWMANYPFTANFFEEFTTFVERSGGFTIS